MPEEPDIICRANEMGALLIGKVITNIIISQPKCLNLPQAEFVEQITGAKVLEISHRGKWLLLLTSKGWLLLNLGMGGEILYHSSPKVKSEGVQMLLSFKDNSHLSVSFWWIGRIYFTKAPDKHSIIKDLGPNMSDLSLEQFLTVLNGRRGAIKYFLLNQKRIAGIGNSYVHDPLFESNIHPLRKISNLSTGEKESLFFSIQSSFQKIIKQGGAAWEKNLNGIYGNWHESNFLVAYKQGETCPKCNTSISKLRTGQTSSFVCLKCQPF